MTTGLLLLVIVIHWSFALGVYLAANTNIKTYQLCIFVIALKIFLISYGYK